jgi:hypothetical protein
MSTLGKRIGSPPTRRSAARSARAPLISETSVDVPPMSKAIAFAKPTSAANRAAPTVPAAGPETRIVAGCAAASAGIATPPDERITSGSGSPASAHAVTSARR